MKTLLAFLFCCSQCLAQEATAIVETEKWKGLASVIEKEGDHKGGYHAKAITAAHVIDGASEISMLYSDGQKSLNCQIISVDKTNDVAIIRVWAPKKLKPLKIASKAIAFGDKVRMVGSELRKIPGTAAEPTTTDQVYADARLHPGDSGGPVLNENGEIVGVISGGWFWYHVEEMQSTWPARGSNLAALRRLISK